MNILTKFALSAGSLNIPVLTGDQVVHNILGITYFIAGVIAVIVIIIAGFTFVTSGNNPASITKAKDAILYSVIGIIVILLAFTITQYLYGRF